MSFRKAIQIQKETEIFGFVKTEKSSVDIIEECADGTLTDSERRF